MGYFVPWHKQFSAKMFFSLKSIFIKLILNKNGFICAGRTFLERSRKIKDARKTWSRDGHGHASDS